MLAPVAVHHELADLVRTAGADILDNAEGFRAALDDFLAENAITEGELNMLVDTVRLGALSRLVEQIGHGADAELAVAEHGDRLARSRGTQETGGARWALAALGFALSLVSEDQVRARHAEMRSAVTQASKVETMPPVQPVRQHPTPPPGGAVTTAPSTAWPAQQAGPEVAMPAVALRSTRRAPLILSGVVVAVVLSLGVGLGVWLGTGDHDPGTGTGSEASQGPGRSELGDGNDPIDPLSAPIADEAARLNAMETATAFVTQFNTYGPDQLDSSGRLAGYRTIADLMTPEFARIFERNVEIAEQTVSEFGAASSATAYGSGAVALEDARAIVLVGGTVEQSYPSAEGDADLTTDPQRFRYVVSLEHIDERGTWLVDDLNDVDDGAPSFASTKGPEPSLPVPEVPSKTWLDEVVSAADEALPAVLSYDYRNLDADLDRGAERLTATYAEERAELFDDGLREQVIDDEVVVTTELSASALGAGSEAEADLFVFLEQTSQTKAYSEPRISRMWATLKMVRDADGQWLIDGIKTDTQ